MLIWLKCSGVSAPRRTVRTGVCPQRVGIGQNPSSTSCRRSLARCLRSRLPAPPRRQVEYLTLKNQMVVHYLEKLHLMTKMEVPCALEL